MGDADDLRAVITELRDVVRGLRDDLRSARADSSAMRERIEELESRLKQDSRTSSKPPSSDGRWSKRRHPPSTKKQSAQPGHPGAARELVDESDLDDTVDHEPDACTRRPRARRPYPSDPAIWRDPEPPQRCRS